MVRIAVDAMGGDYAPLEIVKGSVLAAKEYGVALELVGKQDEIEAELAKYDTSGLDIKITHASVVIEMYETPGVAIRKKYECLQTCRTFGIEPVYACQHIFKRNRPFYSESGSYLPDFRTDSRAILYRRRIGSASNPGRSSLLFGI